ncbi:MAG: cation transporter [Bdellovibrionales bacterium]|nr:cation transporter [Bdellovibrionales bacterium]
MGKNCCEKKSEELDQLRRDQKGVLTLVLVINAVMFIVEFTYGLISHSSALMADSLDMFGDATVYGFSLYVIYRGPIWRARAGMLKGLIMALFGMFVLAQAIQRIVLGVVPIGETMGLIGILALAANLVCLALLFRHKGDDVNMRSTWLCSRNDIIANVSVILASGFVILTGTIWPDVIVAFGIALLFLHSAVQVIGDARKELGAAG